MVLLHEFMRNLGNYDPGHQRRPNVVVDQSFAWITVDVPVGRYRAGMSGVFMTSDAAKTGRR